MRTSEVLIIGDSHTDAIKKALARDKRKEAVYVNCNAYRYSKIKNGKDIGDLSQEELSSILSKLSKDDLVISATGGNQHNTLGLVKHPRAFDFFAEGVEEMEVGSEVIPHSVIWDVFEGGIRGKDGQRIEALKKATVCSVFHLCPPPPKASSEHIMRRYESSFEKAGILENGITSASIRLKLWKLQVDVLRKLCNEWDVELIPVPDDALCPEGFLAEKYYANDATHANEAYGKLVLKQISKIARPVIV